MAQRLHVSGSGSMRVPNGAKYVGRLELICARKGSQSNWPNEDFKHSFKESNGVYRIGKGGSSPRMTKIYDTLQKMILNNGTIVFERGKVYGKKNGNLLIVGNKGRFLVVSSRPLWDVFNYPE
jgi:hypothetical protein